MRRTLFVSFLIVLSALFIYSVPTTFASHPETPEQIKQGVLQFMKEIPGRLTGDMNDLVRGIKEKSAPIVGIGIRFGETAHDDTSRSGRKYVPVVKEVMAGGPAEKSGVRAGDVILAVNGRPFTSANDLLDEVRGPDNSPGRTVALKLRRYGVEVPVPMTTAVLSEKKREAAELQATIEQEGKALIAKVEAAATAVTKALKDGTFDLQGATSKDPKDPNMKAFGQALNEFDKWYDNKENEIERLLNNK